MPIRGCVSGLVALAVMPLLLLPAGYYVQKLQSWSGSEALLASVDVKLEPPPTRDAFWPEFQFTSQPMLDLLCTVVLVVIASFVFISEWIQRKLLERRMIKLNQYLGTSVERLRSWDAQQEQLESTLKIVQTATLEYNLLYLLLRQKRCLANNCSRKKATLF